MASLDYEPLFSHEDKREVLLRSASRLRRWLYKMRPGTAETGVALWLLLVVLGFRRQEVQRAVAEVVSEGSRMVRAASRDTFGLLQRVSSRPGQSSRRLLSDDAPAAPGDFASAAAEAAAELEAARTAHRDRSMVASPEGLQQAAEQGQDAQNLNGRLAWLFPLVERHMDTALVAFLGYKLALLVLYTMPLSYGFGAKRAFLKWASRAKLFRLYLLLAPFAGIGMVGAASIIVQYAPRRRPLAPAVVVRWRALAFLNAVLTYCTIRLFELIRGDPHPVIEVEETAQDRDLLAFHPPKKDSFVYKIRQSLSWPQRQLFPPELHGAEVLGEQRERFLFVGNHAILGVDVTLLMQCLFEKTGIWPRPLGEHSWFSVPIVGELLFSIGGVDGTRHNCDLLMRRGDCILVYPGGAREAWKRTTDKPYEVLWGESHVGFARMAVRHGYTIVPVATVGTEDVIKPVYDLPLQSMLTAGGIFKMPKGSSKAFERGARIPLVWPRFGQAQKVYFKLMPPLHTEASRGQDADDALVYALRDATKRSLEEGIQWLLNYREADADRFVFGGARRGSNGGAAEVQIQAPKIPVSKL